MDRDPFLGVSVRVSFNSEIGRFGLIVRVGGREEVFEISITVDAQPPPRLAPNLIEKEFQFKNFDVMNFTTRML